MDERTLIERSANGDSGAFEKLIEQYQQGIINHAYTMFRNREDALDMAQETLVKAFAGISGFNGQSSFKTWLYRIATNVCLDELRKRKRRAATVSITSQEDDGECVEHEIADDSADPAHAALRSELREAILKAMGELDEEYRVVIALRELEGMDYATIAKMLRISLGTVKSRISRARQQLREKLSAHRELL